MRFVRPAGLAGVKTVAVDLTDSSRAGLSPHLDHALRVADPFHVVRVANRCLDKVRRRVQNETLGHRGRKDDPLYRISKLLLTGDGRLDDQGWNRMLSGLRVGDPYDEVAGAWLAKESVRDIYLVDDPADAATLVDRAIVACRQDDVAEIRTLGRTLALCRTEILNHHTTGASKGSTEGLNLVIKKVKRVSVNQPRIPTLRPLPAPLPLPRRRHHLAQPAHTTPHRNPSTPTQMRRASNVPVFFPADN